MISGRFVGTLALAGSILFALAGSAIAQKNVRWKMYSPFPTKIPLMGSGGKGLADNLRKLSGGTFSLKIFESGTLASGTHYFDRVSEGLIDAAWGFSSFHADKSAALLAFTGLPFGPRAGAFLAWMKFGGGETLRDEIYRKHGVKGMTCGLLPPESAGWFRQEIETLDQFRGLKMRSFGLGANVMKKLGVKTKKIAGGDIVPALELETIDAAEFSAPSIDEVFKFFESAKHNYFPGWQAQWTLVELLVNRGTYENLSGAEKAQLDSACGLNISSMLAEGEATQFLAMERMKSAGAIVHRWPNNVIDALRVAWIDTAAEQAAKDPQFRKVYKSYSNFLEAHKVWSGITYVD